ncbi:MAG: hypothetical protein GYA51_11620 [Candidatus Methanofastidiosa archaeon]|nr:hypothetical protein [Candidatus Methanofastidiosa archaeon]
MLTYLGIEITNTLTGAILSLIFTMFLFYIPGFLCFFVYFRYHKTRKIPEGKLYLYDEDNPEEYAESTKYKYKMEKKDEARTYVLLGVLLLAIGFFIYYFICSDIGYSIFWAISTILWVLFLIVFFYWYMKPIKKEKQKPSK